MTDEQRYIASVQGQAEELLKAWEQIKEVVMNVWNALKKAVRKVFESWVIALQNEEAKLTVRIYQRTKNKRIKKKKFKQLVGYLVDELTV